MEAEKWTFNAHEAHFEPPDVVWIKWHGKTELEDVRWAANLYRQLATARGPLYIASDVRDASISADARNYIAREAKPEWFRVALYMGAGLPQRAMGKAINLALMLLGKPTVEMVFVDDVVQMREWIERRRARTAGRKAS